jgi:cytochrome c553
MNEERLISLKNRWFTGSIAALVLLMVLSAAVGFVWLPRLQAQRNLATIWDAICSATGVAAPFSPPGLPDASAMRSSNVVVAPGMMAPADSQSIGRGATLAMQCTMCHGARGMSPAEAPHLAGQVAEATYKQLRDLKSGHRLSAVMQPLVANLDDRAMRDLAAYYAFLPHEHAAGGGEAAAPELVSNGAPMRAVVACMACHGAGIHKAAAPLLDGQPEAYLQAQLTAFHGAARHNDINGQMRNAVRHLTPEEIALIAKYYAGR